MDYLYLGTVLAVFVAAALLIEGLHSLWKSHFGAQAKRVGRRLRALAPSDRETPSEVSIQKKRVLSSHPQIRRLLQRFRRVDRLDHILAQAGSQLDVATFFLISAAAGIATLVVLALMQVPLIVAVAAAIAAGVIPFMLAMHRRRKRFAQVEQQLPDALGLMSRALRAGHSLPSAIKMVCEEMPDPLGGEFRTVFNEVSYGVPMQESMRNLAARVPGSDIGFLVVAILIQRETGGNLTELLDTIAAIIRERLKLFGQVQVYSAEGRLSAWILGLLPFLLGAALYLVNPDFMQTLWTDPGGMKMIFAVLGLMVSGAFWMRTLVRIRV